MDELKCKICFKNFCSEKNLPIFVSCGHTFCVPCVKELQNCSQNCPLCRAVIPISKVQFPINYSILNLATELLKGKLQINSSMKGEIERLKERIESYQKDFRKDLESLEYCFSQLLSLEKRLESSELVANNDDANIVSEVRNTLSTFKKSDPTVMPKFRQCSQEFKSFYMYLNPIQEAITNGEKVYSAHYVKGNVMYGSVTIWKEYLLFHNLCLPKIDSTDFVIEFDDLKRYEDKRFEFAFLKVRCNREGLQRMVIIDLENTCSWVFQFIKLCTGELGPSYLHSKFVRGKDDYQFCSIMDVQKNANNPAEENLPIDYVPAHAAKESRNVEAKSIIVKGFRNGRFKIEKASRETNLYECIQTGEIIGKIENFPFIERMISDDDDTLSVVDCGIAFRISY